MNAAPRPGLMIGSPLTDDELADARAPCRPGRRRDRRRLRASRAASSIRSTSCNGSSPHHRTLPESETDPFGAVVLPGPRSRCRSGPSPSCCDDGQRFFNVRRAHRERAVLRVAADELHGSRRLARAHAHGRAGLDTRRRLAQTGEMLLDVMGANDERDGATVRCRAPCVPSAARRTAVPRRGPAHAASRPDVTTVAVLGEPINQEDLLGTLLGVHGCVIESLERFGVAGRRASTAMRTCASG